MNCNLIKSLHLLIIALLMMFLISCETEKMQIKSVELKEELLELDAVELKGILGEALSASENGRIKTLPNWENGKLITMFSQQARQKNEKMDWYGEHGGKWLYMAARAAKRNGDEELKSLLFKTSDYLINTQNADGYLGTYSSSQRFTSSEPKTHKWSWDIWNLSYIVLGLLEVNHYFPNEEYLDAAKNIGKLFLDTFGEGKNNITNYGTNHGLSSTVILDPLVELFGVTKNKKYLKLAVHIVKEMEERKELQIISLALKNKDMAKVGNGKAYQLSWNLTAIAKLYQYTGNPDYLQAVKNAWQNIVDEHLTITGGPWGGIGQHYEIFNRKGFWSPYGFVETCSIMAWIQLNRELLKITGEVKYAEQIEKSVYNALLGAQYPNGEEWCYHSFTNGRRHVAKHDDCCPSSGAIGLEEIPPLVYTLKDDGIACNLYTASLVNIHLNESTKIKIEQRTDYPNNGKILLNLNMQEPISFPLFIRIPEWTENSSIKINGNLVDYLMDESGYVKIERKWKDGDSIILNFPMTFQVHQKLEHIPKYDKDISSVEWFAVKRGPLVYSVNGLLFGKQRESVIDIPLKKIKLILKSYDAQNEIFKPFFKIKISDKKSLSYLPFYLADGRRPGAWRLTWVQNKIN